MHYIPGKSIGHDGVKKGCIKTCLGERTAEYFDNIITLKRIKYHYPNIKIIIFLREPISRLYSEWNQKRQYQEVTSFEEWAEKHISLDISNNDVTNGSNYYKVMKNIYNIFEKKNVHVTISERVLNNPLIEYNKIIEFLGELPLDTLNFDKTINKYKYNQNINKNFRKKLIDIYTEHNLKLFKLLEYEIHEWNY